MIRPCMSWNIQKALSLQLMFFLTYSPPVTLSPRRSPSLFISCVSFQFLSLSTSLLPSLNLIHLNVRSTVLFPPRSALDGNLWFYHPIFGRAYVFCLQLHDPNVHELPSKSCKVTVKKKRGRQKNNHWSNWIAPTWFFSFSGGDDSFAFTSVWMGKGSVTG